MSNSNKYKVVGVATGSQMVETWHFPDLKLANQFAKQLALDSGQDVAVFRLVTYWKVEHKPFVKKGNEKDLSKAKGGRARQSKLTPEQRKEHASKMANARWNK